VVGLALLGALAGGRIAYGAAANVGVTFPPDLATHDTAAVNAKWNLSGNRCQYNCNRSGGGTGPTDVGMSATATAIVAAGTAPPQIEILRDGRLVARTTPAAAVKNTNLSDADYDFYNISITNRCATTKVCTGGSTNDGNFCTTVTDCPGSFFAACSPKFCNNDQECNRPSQADVCLLCDGATCSDTSQDTLCVRTCVNPLDATKNGIECSADFTCGGGGTCVSPNCRLLKNCAKGTGGTCTGFTVADCTSTGSSGASLTGPGDPDGSGVASRIGAAPVHTVTARVEGTARNPSGVGTIGPLTIGASQNVFRVVNTSSATTTCSTFCGGTSLTTTGALVPAGTTGPACN